MTKHLIGLFGRDADPEHVVAAAREAFERLGIEIPPADEAVSASDETSKGGPTDAGG